MREHTPQALAAAKELRRRLTMPELLLWQRLRGNPSGIKFRKQHPISNLVLDFYCAAKRIAIEVDGIVHDMAGRPERDALRDAKLAALGVSVLRIRAAEVLADVDAAADSIVQYCAAAPPPTRL